jgi:hypothetical protein
LSSEASTFTAGKGLARFRGQPIGAQTWIFILLPGAMCIIVIYLYGIYLAFSTYQVYGPSLAIARSQAWFLLATILLILLGAFFVYRMLISMQRVTIFENGLQMRSFFLRTRSFSWMDLCGISSSAVRLTFFGKTVRTTPSARLFTNSGQSYDVPRGILGIPKIVKIVKSRLNPLIWPGILADFITGKPIRFGRISVNSEGIQISRRMLPWSSITRLYIEGGFLVVELRDNSTHKAATIDIPNLELLLNAVSEIKE